MYEVIRMNYMIKDMPKEERPRERLLSQGVESLSDSELLAIILKTGTKDSSVKDIAIEILNSVKEINDLKNITISALMKIKGVGVIKAIEIIATIELGKRIFLKEKENKKMKLNNPELIYKASKYLFYEKKQEYFYCLYFDNKQRLIERKLLFMGTINKSIVHPREVFKEAYLLSASSIVCMHNHPSGDVHPSKEDIELTRALVQIGQVANIPVVDHIVVSNDNYYSFYENDILL